MFALALAALSLAAPAHAHKRPVTYTLTATRDCRAPGIAHARLRYGTRVRFTAPKAIAGRAYHVRRRPGWRPLHEPTHVGHASVFEINRGIAVRHMRRGGFYLIHSPNGRWALHVQRDWGPAPWTGRWLDLGGQDAAMHGYHGSFPTDQGNWTGWRIGHRPLGLHEGPLPKPTAIGVCRIGHPGPRGKVSFRVLRYIAPGG